MSALNQQSLALAPSAAFTRTHSSTKRLELPRPKVLYGCNRYYDSTVMCQSIQPGPVRDLMTGDACVRFASGFIDRFGTLERAPDPQRFTADFRTRLESPDGVPLYEALFEAILVIESHVRLVMRRPARIAFAQAMSGRSSRRVRLVWETDMPNISRRILRVAMAGIAELLPEDLRTLCPAAAEEYAALFKSLRSSMLRHQWSTAAGYLGLAARRQGIPFEPLGGAYLRIGQGAYQSVVYPSVHDLHMPCGSAVDRHARLDRGAALEEATHRDDRETITVATMDDPVTLAKLLPHDGPLSIPTAVIVGADDATIIGRHLDAILRGAGATVGLSGERVTTILGKPVRTGSMARRGALRYLNNDPRVEMIVSVNTSRNIRRDGLLLDRCTAAAVVEPASGNGKPKRTCIDVIHRATTGPLVVSAMSAWVGHVQRRRDAGQITMVALDENTGALRKHLASGGLALIGARRGNARRIDVRSGDRRVASFPPLPSAAAGGKQSAAEMLQWMHAVALALGLGLSPTQLENAMQRRQYMRR